RLQTRVNTISRAFQVDGGCTAPIKQPRHPPSQRETAWCGLCSANSRHPAFGALEANPRGVLSGPTRVEMNSTNPLNGGWSGRRGSNSRPLPWQGRVYLDVS